MTIQPLNDREPLVNPDGTATQFFLRQLQERGITTDSKITAEQAIQLIEEWSANRDINVTAPIIGGGSLDNDVTIGMADSGVTPGSYTNTNLTVDQFGRITAAANGSGGGGGNWWFNPPAAADFTANSADGTLPIMADDADVGLTINFGPHVTGNINRCVWKALPSAGATDWEVTVRLNFSVAQISNIMGLMAWESATGRTLLLNQNATTREIRIDRQTALNSGLTGVVSTIPQLQVPQQANWLRLGYLSGTNTYYWSISTNGKQWHLIGANTVVATTPFTTRADRVGIFSWCNGANSNWLQMAICENWTQSW